MGAALPVPGCGRELEPVPVVEDRPLRPASVYGITKRDTEELALVLGEAYGIEATALRYLNVYGPRQALGNPYTGVAAIFSARLLSGKAPLVFEDGHQIRDLVHVSDIVAATRAAMEAPGAPGRAFNVATGRQVRIVDLAALARRADRAGDRAGDHRRVPGRRHPPLLRLDRGRARAARLRGRGRARRRACPSWPAGSRARRVAERGDEAIADLRRRGLVG